MKKIFLVNIMRSFPLFFLIALAACSSSGEGKQSGKKEISRPEKINSNIEGSGESVEVTFLKGKAHNHPSFAIWIEDTAGNYIQTLFVTRSVGKGTFVYGDKTGYSWKPGDRRIPAALPYWSHKRGIWDEDGLYTPSSKHPVPDAYTGATPAGDFVLNSRSDRKLPAIFRVLLEVNQTWDWNEYWTNDKFPDDPEYSTSCQPSLVYEAALDTGMPDKTVIMKPIGHGHYSGKDGSLNSDMSTLTTALRIAGQISVRLLP